MSMDYTPFDSNHNWRLFLDRVQGGNSKLEDIIKVLELIKESFETIYEKFFY
jgi:hypothetical protein